MRSDLDWSVGREAGTMAAQVGSFRYMFSQRSKERLQDPYGLSTIPLLDPHGGRVRRSWGDRVRAWGARAQEVAGKVWEFARSDRRKVIFAIKMGMTLTLMSVLIFLPEPFPNLNKYSVWGFITVVVVFEFSIGGTLSKGFNRGLGTILAGGLALGATELSKSAGELEEVVLAASVFIAGSSASFIKLYPSMKPYEYGFRVFLMTFSIVVVTGYRTGEFVETAANRLLLICIGAGVTLCVNIFIYPIWAGEDLHNLVAKNFTDVAKSLEGCVNGYLQCIEYDRVPSKIFTYQASDDPLYRGYRAALEATSQENSLLSFAEWEPPHGPYNKFRYPWKNYIKVSGALRHCAFTVMALHGCILSEIQAPPERRLVFRNELQRVGAEGARVLRELGDKVKTMTRLSAVDILQEVHDAAEELQKKIDHRSYLLVNSESWEIGRRPEIADDALNGVNIMDDNSHRCAKSQSEAVLDLRYVQVPNSWDARQVNLIAASPVSSVMGFQDYQKQPSWLRSLSLYPDIVPPVEQSRTYESASALSLATFASLLIEFVARLSYLVETFEELSEKASFKEPVLEPGLSQEQGFCSWWSRCLGSKD